MNLKNCTIGLADEAPWSTEVEPTKYPVGLRVRWKNPIDGEHPVGVVVENYKLPGDICIDWFSGQRSSYDEDFLDENVEPDFRTAYMCATDYAYELGEAAGPYEFFSSAEEAFEKLACGKSCGLTKVKVVFQEHLAPTDEEGGFLTGEDIEEKSEKYIKSMKDHLTYLREKIARYESYAKKIDDELKEIYETRFKKDK